MTGSHPLNEKDVPLAENAERKRSGSGPEDDEAVSKTAGLDAESTEKDDSGASDDDSGPASVNNQYNQHKREKRLAMNRASARERRRRKRVLLERLEERVLELTKQLQSQQDANVGLQSHIRKLEGELAQSHTVIATLSSAANSRGASSAGSVHSTAGPFAGVPSNEESRIRALLLGNTPGVGGYPEMGGGVGGSLNDILLAERQMLLDLQAQQRRRSLLEASSSALATAGRLSGSHGMSGASLQLLGRMNYLDDFSQNTVRVQARRRQASCMDWGGCWIGFRVC